MPLFWILLAWSSYAYKRQSPHGKKLLYIAFFVSFFFTNTVIFKEFSRIWEIPGKKFQAVEHHDIAIVLGGMFEYNNDLDVLSIRRGGDRIWQALALYHRGKVDKILISGAHGFVQDRGLREAQQLRDELLVWGIPSEALLIDSLSKNTYENALESNKVIAHYNLEASSFLLITSGLHMRRSMACFEKQGLEVTPYSTDLFTGPKRAYHWDEYIIPSLSTANDWSKLTHEWAGYVTYKIMGYF